MIILDIFYLRNSYIYLVFYITQEILLARMLAQTSDTPDCNKALCCKPM
jgi:hypothetical protein